MIMLLLLGSTFALILSVCPWDGLVGCRRCGCEWDNQCWGSKQPSPPTTKTQDEAGAPPEDGGLCLIAHNLNLLRRHACDVFRKHATVTGTGGLKSGANLSQGHSVDASPAGTFGVEGWKLSSLEDPLPPSGLPKKLICLLFFGYPRIWVAICQLVQTENENVCLSEKERRKKCLEKVQLRLLPSDLPVYASLILDLLLFQEQKLKTKISVLTISLVNDQWISSSYADHSIWNDHKCVSVLC